MLKPGISMTAVALALLAPVLSLRAAPVTVGTSGNEPVIAAAPDGTLYVSALQHIYRSTNSGASWTKLPGPIYASSLNLASDSSMSVDPGNRLYFTFDYPYAGTTAVCTSDDKGDTFACNPAVVPGGTDRMWVLAPTTSTAYEVTNQGLYETAFLVSNDRGQTFTPKAVASGLLEPQSGPLLQRNCSNKVLQPIKVYGTTPDDVPEVKIYVYDPASVAAVISDVRGTGLPLPTALPSGALSLDGALYVASEEPNPAGGKQAVLARSFDEGVSWTKLPAIPTTSTGTATFTWVAAGAPGHVGVIYYYTPQNGDPGALTNATWSTMWAESYNADSANPTWTVTTVEQTIHIGALCIAADCTGTNRFAGDFINAIIDANGAAHLSWMKRENGTGPVSIRYERIQSAPASAYVAPPCGLTVASRKTHGTRNTFDVELPLLGPHGVECRTGGVAGNHTLVFRFAAPVTNVGSASVTSGKGRVSSSGPGSDPREYLVNLTEVENKQTINVRLENVGDANGPITGEAAVAMHVLLGDTNGDFAVNSGDSQQTRNRSGEIADAGNFRSDVNLDRTINSGDAFNVRAQSGSSTSAEAARGDR
jgi:hypothetical protein